MSTQRKSGGVIIRLIVNALLSFFLGGFLIMTLAHEVFPIFGHPGLGYWASCEVAILLWALLGVFTE